MTSRPVPQSVLAAVHARIRQAGLKPDIPEARVVRAIRAVAGSDPSALREDRLDEVVELLAVHESWFFRDAKQLAALAAHILPTLTPPVRVWSIGCGHGQEPWSLAMLLADTVGGDWHITASDFSAAAIAAAERGVYPTARLRGLSAARRDRHLQPHGPDEWAVGPHLRPHVDFVRHNISKHTTVVRPGSCHVVMCRNVFIYLHEEAVASALSSIGRALTPEGWLMLGTAESLLGISDEFTAVALPGAFAYQKATSARTPTDPAPSSGVGRGEPSTPVPDVDELVLEGRRAAAAGRHDDAVRAFRQAAYLDPDRPDAHAGLAAALEEIGDVRGAARARAAADRLDTLR